MSLHLKRKLDLFIKRSHWYNEVLFRDCRKFWELKEDQKFDIVNLGSSSGVYDFCYEESGIIGANWAIAPQSLVGDFAILKQYRNHIKDGGIVICPLCPFTAISGGVPYIEERCYSFLNYKAFPGGHYITNCKLQAIKERPYAVYPLIQLIEDVKWHMRGNTERTKIKTEEELVADAKGWMESWKDQFDISDMNQRFIGQHESVYSDTVKVLSDMIEYCQVEGLQFVLVVPPVYHTLGELLTQTAREQLLDTFIHQANRNRVPFYNFIDDAQFSNRKQLFRDSYFLNKEGARKFTNYLLETIKTI